MSAVVVVVLDVVVTVVAVLALEIVLLVLLVALSVLLGGLPMLVLLDVVHVVLLQLDGLLSWFYGGLKIEKETNY